MPMSVTRSMSNTYLHLTVSFDRRAMYLCPYGLAMLASLGPHEGTNHRRSTGVDTR